MKTPCPQCATGITVRGEEADCPGCGLHVRFVDVPERACASCGKAVAVTGRVVRCAACGTVQPGDPRRSLQHVAVCPRCRRRVAIEADQQTAQCPACSTSMRVRDTF